MKAREYGQEMFPCTRLMHMPVMPPGYLFRTGYQLVRKRIHL